MTLQKRRVIYMTDEAWEAAKKQAEPFGISISAYLRSLVIGGRLIPVALREQFESMTADHSAQQERDAILKRVNRKTGE